MKYKRARFDIECDGLLDTLTKVHCLALRVDNEPSRLFVGAAITEGLALLDQCDVITGHNIIAYDLPALYKIYTWKPKARVEDTFVASLLIFPDIGTGGHAAHSLEEWGLRVGKEKIKFGGPWDTYTEEMGTYCLGDVDVTVLLDELLLAERKKWDWEPALRLELAFAFDFAEQGARGVMVDLARAIRLVYDIDVEMEQIAKEVEPKLPAKPGTKGQIDAVTPPKLQFKKDGTPSANVRKFFDELRSENHDGVIGYTEHWARKGERWVKLPYHAPLQTEFPATLADQQHIKSWLMDKGWKPTMWSFKKQKDEKGKLRFVRGDDGQLVPTWPKFHDKGVLCANLESINSEFPDVKQVVRWIVLRHRRGLIQSIIDAVRPDGTVSATGISLGTPTSRVTHSVVANIPKADEEVTLGKECRSIFIARPNRTLVGVDGAGLELRMLAHYVGSPAIINMIVNGKKEDGTEIHTFLWKACQQWVKSRTVQKNVNYAWLYGASDKKIGQTAGHPDAVAEKVGKHIRAALVAAVPGLEALMDKVETAAKRGYIKAIDGRKIPIRGKHATLNTLLQSAGSILIKMATVAMNRAMRRLNLDAFMVIHYHDEVQLDSAPLVAKSAGSLFVKGLKAAGNKVGCRCPLDGEVKLGHSWADTH